MKSYFKSFAMITVSPFGNHNDAILALYSYNY